MTIQKLKLAVIIPVYNDWVGIPSLLENLDLQLRSINNLLDIAVILVDDGSSIPVDGYSLVQHSCTLGLEILRLGCNLGHQRAIAIGLSEIVSRSFYDLILVLDGDGEDRPSDAITLIKEWQNHPNAVIVARRRERQEGLIFQIFYHVYKIFFRALCGRSLDFGNFAVLSHQSAMRLVYMPELWNHFAASVLRSRLPLISIPIAKGKRTNGHSKMNFVSLVNHGLSAASVLIDVVFARILILSCASAVLFIGAALYVLHVRLYTIFAIPGWASSMIGFALLGMFQLLTLTFVISFLTLSTRSSFQRPTILQARAYIESRKIIYSCN